MQDRVVVVTGAARGIGRASAVACAREGADVVICDMARQLDSVPYEMGTLDDMAETVRLVEKEGREAAAVQADVADATQMRGVVDAAIERFGRIDALHANAGIFSGGVPAWELTDEQWDTMAYVNLRGVWQTCKQVIPHMRERGRGSIVMTSSMAGLAGLRNCAHYVSMKHGVIGLMKALAVELGPEGLRVNAVCPQGTRTPLLMNQFADDLFGGFPFGSGLGQPHMVEDGLRTQTMMPVGFIEADDIANAVTWLLSDQARYVTGHALPIDAGALVEVYK